MPRCHAWFAQCETPLPDRWAEDMNGKGRHFRIGRFCLYTGFYSSFDKRVRIMRFAQSILLGRREGGVREIRRRHAIVSLETFMT